MKSDKKKTGGYVFLWKKLLNSDLWLKEKFTKGQAWVDLFANANYQDGKMWAHGSGVEVEIKRGQIAWSELTMAARWRWSRGTVRRYLKYLENDMKIVQQKTPVTTIITILNYDSYQKFDTTESTTDNTTDDTTRGTTDGTTGSTRYNKDNTIKKEYNIPPEIKGACITIVSEYFQSLARQNERIAENLEKYRVRFEGDCAWLLKNGYTEEQIRRAANWAREDSFWGKNFHSFSKLRDLNKEHIRYIDVFLQKAGKKKQNSTGPINPPADYYRDGNARTEVKNA